jgi:hypothetical protein
MADITLSVEAPLGSNLEIAFQDCGSFHIHIFTLQANTCEKRKNAGREILRASSTGQGTSLIFISL